MNHQFLVKSKLFTFSSHLRFLPHPLLTMSKKNVIWCAHPKHDEIMPNEKKRYWKTGPKPSHPKGKRTISQDFANFINEQNERISNGSSRKLTAGDYLCSTYFRNEQSNISYNLDNQLNSPY